MAQSTPNALEKIRLRLGISRPEMLRSIGAREGREGPFLCDTSQIDPIFVRRAQELEQLYEAWKQEIITQVAAMGALDAKSLAKLFGTYPMKILRMRYLGLLGGGEDPTYAVAGTFFTAESIRRLFDYNEGVLAQTQGRGLQRAVARRSPLGGLFIKWLEARKGTFLRRGTAHETDTAGITA